MRAFAKKLVRPLIDAVAAENERRAKSTLDRVANEIVDRVIFATETQRLLASSQSRAPNDLFGTVTDGHWLWLNTEGYRKLGALRDILPGLPSEEVQRGSIGMAGEDTLRQAFSVYMIFRDAIKKHGRPLADCRAVLDFGCGWGRVLRFFFKDIDPARLWGVDMWKRQIDCAKALSKWGNFMDIEKEPPLSFPDGTFDAIFAFSVFSHVSEGVQNRWLPEFKRVLAPGGVLIATTWGRGHADYLEGVKSGRHSLEEHYDKMVRERFQGRDKWLADYDSGRFCHLDMSWPHYADYGETSISERYVRAEWSKLFTILEYSDDRAACIQDIIVARA